MLILGIVLDFYTFETVSSAIIHKYARTIADLDGKDSIEDKHILEVIDIEL